MKKWLPESSKSWEVWQANYLKKIEYLITFGGLLLRTLDLYLQPGTVMSFFASQLKLGVGIGYGKFLFPTWKRNVLNGREVIRGKKRSVFVNKKKCYGLEEK